MEALPLYVVITSCCKHTSITLIQKAFVKIGGFRLITELVSKLIIGKVIQRAIEKKLDNLNTSYELPKLAIQTVEGKRAYISWNEVDLFSERKELGDDLVG